MAQTWSKRLIETPWISLSLIGASPACLALKCSNTSAKSKTSKSLCCFSPVAPTNKTSPRRSTLAQTITASSLSAHKSPYPCGVQLHQPQPRPHGDLNITQRDITVTSITAVSKQYDGGATATINSGVFGSLANGETLSLSGSGVFANANNLEACLREDQPQTTAKIQSHPPRLNKG